MKTLKDRLNKEKLILTGSFANIASKYNLRKFDFHKSRFQNHTKDLTGFYEILNVVYPEIVKEVFEKYAKLGCDVLMTNTSLANEYYLKNLDLALLSYEINLASAKLVREIATKYSLINKSKARYVAGTISNIEKAVDFEEANVIYSQQFKGLLAGKVDAFIFTEFITEKNLTNALRVLNAILTKRNKVFPVLVIEKLASGKEEPFITNKLLEFYKNEFEYLDIIAVGCAEEVNEICNFPVTQKLIDTVDSNIILYPIIRQRDFSLSDLSTCLDIFIQYGKVKLLGGEGNIETDYFKYLDDTLKILNGD